MEWLGPLLFLIVWVVGVPLVVFGALKVVGYDFDKPWLMWRTKAGPLPLWIYIGFSACLGLALLVWAANR